MARETIDGYTFMSIYRNRSIYVSSDPNEKWEYAALMSYDAEKLTVFDHTFKGIQQQMDEILGLSPKPKDIVKLLRDTAEATPTYAALLEFAAVEIEDLRHALGNWNDDYERRTRG